MIQLPITIIIPTKDEERNIGRCLLALSGAERLIVVDSRSSDTTAAIALSHGAEVVQFESVGGYPKKRQWALDSIAVGTPWVMLVDADELISGPLWDEIATSINQRTTCDAYMVTKGFHFLGRRFRYGGFSHSAVMLFKNGKVRFEKLLRCPPDSQDMEVHERLIVDGTIGQLKAPLIHKDFKGLSAYIDRHNKYSTWEALLRLQFLRTGSWGEEAVKPRLFGNAQELRRFLKMLAIRVPFEPALWFIYHYVVRLGFLEGRPGLIASRIRANYIADTRSKMYEMLLDPEGRH